jgi:flagellar assembly protein FliH
MSSSRAARLLDSALTSVEVAPIAPPSSALSAYAGAYEQGRAAGRLEVERAHAAAVEKACADLDAARAALQAAADELRHRREDALGLSVTDAAALALRITEALVGSLRQRPERWLPGRIAEALALVPEHSEPLVRLHPDDLAALRDTERPPRRRESDVGQPDGELGRVLGTTPQGVTGTRFVSDRSVARGGCVVEAGPSHVEAGLDAALERVRAVLLESP